MLDAVYQQFEGRLPQALLLLGISGIGKFTLAKRLLRVQAAPSDILSLEVPRVADVREFIRWAGLKPFAGQVKGIAIRGDHATEEALNALLKVLEEPPFYLHIIITSSKKLPLTIVSRCLRFVCSPLDDGDIIDVLVNQEGVRSQTAGEIAKLAAGSLGKALRLAEHEDERTQIVSYMELVAASDWIGLVNATRGWTSVHVECLIDELLRRFSEPGDFALVQRDNAHKAMVVLGMPMKPSLKGMVIARTLIR